MSVIRNVIMDKDIRKSEREKVIKKWIDIEKEIRVLKNL
jgi:hypothetical protein